jgi:hypothetical protein
MLGRNYTWNKNMVLEQRRYLDNPEWCLSLLRVTKSHKQNTIAWRHTHTHTHTHTHNVLWVPSVWNNIVALKQNRQERQEEEMFVLK